MSAGDSITRASRSAGFFRPSQLRKLRGSEQVAAVCYRVGEKGIEFLLVQTRGGRWTFPKGGVEPGLSNAQTAALEAFEEAGVHGRMEEQSFARYTRRKRNGHSTPAEVAVHAHLCEVSRLGTPQEAGRNPTWFSAEKAKRRLQEDRRADDGGEFARVVDRAVTRIQRLLNPPCAPSDALQKVRIEAPSGAGAYVRIEETLFAQFIRRPRGTQPSTITDLSVEGERGRVLQLRPANGPRLLAEHMADYGTESPRVVEAKARTSKKKRR